MQKKVAVILTLAVIIGLTFNSTVFSGEIIKASNIGKFNKVTAKLSKQSSAIIGIKRKSALNIKTFEFLLSKGETIRKGDIFKVENYYNEQGNNVFATYLKLWTANHISYTELYSTNYTDSGFVEITKTGKYYLEGKFEFVLSLISGTPKKTITTKGYFKAKY